MSSGPTATDPAARPPTADRSSPNTVAVVGFTAFGSVLLGLAALFDEVYWQGLFLNVGTTLFLFAGLALAEPLLVRRISKALGPRTLGQAQEALKEALGDRSSAPRPSWATKAQMLDDIEQSVRRAGAAIVKGGLVQQPSAESDELVFRDAGKSAVTWKISWRGGTTLSHVVTTPNGHRIGGWGPRAITFREGTVSEADVRVLREFEDQVFRLMLVITDRLRPRPA